MKELPIVTFKNITEIKNHQFAGNHYQDGSAFDAIHKFVVDTNNSLEDRAEALRQMIDKGMGCGRDEHLSDQKIVTDYLSEM
jgi:hypothetical protein